MGIFEEYKDKSDQEIIAMMEKIGNSGTDNLIGIHILRSILDSRAGKLTARQNLVMIRLTWAIYVLTAIMAIIAVATFFNLNHYKSQSSPLVSKK